MKNSVELNILGQKLILRSDESEEYVREVEGYLVRKIEEVKHKTKAVATLDLALLVALNVTGELISVKDKLEGMENRSGELCELLDKRLAR